MPDHPTTTSRPPRIVWLGLAVVLAAAAVLSFDALRHLAIAVAIPDYLAWLLPISVDAGASVSCAVWLGGRTHPKAARFAGGMTWALLAVTVAGNAGQLGMHANRIDPPWWVAVLVGSIPPAIVGATVHLLVLLIRRPVAPTAEPQQPTRSTVTVGEHVQRRTDEFEQEVAAILDEPGNRGWPTAETSEPSDEPTVADRPAVIPPMSDEDIVAEAKEWAVDLRRPPSRDEMLERYRIGASRCRRLRKLLGWHDEPTAQPTASPRKPTARSTTRSAAA